MPTDQRIDRYIAESGDFARDILNHLRALMHRHCPAVEESIRWRIPFFDYKGRPLANMAAFKSHAAFGFWDRDALRTGQEGNGAGQFGRIRTLADLPDDSVIADKIREGMAMIEAGEKPKRSTREPKPELEVPPALVHALTQDAAAAETFAAFTPANRREYCAWIAEAKRDETRDKRVAEAIAMLREGKKRNWKYENC
ncbi:YdeI family protein [Sphingomonas sp. MMS24-J45]|uniref:YdeI/OmpD-associated family protein n=1 Tax=Sphingomonas sp. MMS24-J45 TaxID=3238806 RepID=UPI00384A94AC